MLLETKVTIIEDRPDRMVISESFKPQRWGGFGLRAEDFLLLVLYPFIRLVWGARKVSFDRAYQHVRIQNRFLFSGKVTEVPFSDIERFAFTPREKTVSAGGSGRQGPGDVGMAFTLDLEELFLVPVDGTPVKISTTYRNDRLIREIGVKITELTRKPFGDTPGKG